MKFINENDEEPRDYNLQKDKTTKVTFSFVVVMLEVLIIAVIASGIYFIKF